MAASTLLGSLAAYRASVFWERPMRDSMKNHASGALKLQEALILTLITAGLGVQITIF